MSALVTLSGAKSTLRRSAESVVPDPTATSANRDFRSAIGSVNPFRRAEFLDLITLASQTDVGESWALGEAMRRREFIAGLGGTTATWPLVARAQQPAKRRTTIGFLSTAGNASSILFEAFRQELRRLGHIEGETVVTEFRSARSDPSKLPALAGELVRMPVDVIVTDGGAPAALAAMHAYREQGSRKR